MANDELIDSHVPLKQCKLAVDALLRHEAKKHEEQEENELLPGTEPNIWLNITVKKIPSTFKIKPVKIPVAHPIADPRTTNVCLITKDPQREYKDLLEKHNVKFVSRVVGVSKLKGKFRPFEARRMLLKESGLFLADDRVIPLLPKLLGKKWFDAKKQPIPVSLARKDLKAELERAISSTYMHQNRGTWTSIKVGTLTQKPQHILDNIKTALPAIVRHIYDGWDNVQAFHIKTNSSVSLPIWTCTLDSGEGGRWDELSAAQDAKEEKENKESEGEDEDEDEDEQEEEERPKKRKKPSAQKAEPERPTKKVKPSKPSSSAVESSPKKKSKDSRPELSISAHKPSPKAPPATDSPGVSASAKAKRTKEAKPKTVDDTAAAAKTTKHKAAESVSKTKKDKSSKPTTKAQKPSSNVDKTGETRGEKTENKAQPSIAPQKTIAKSLTKEELKQKRSSKGVEKKKSKVLVAGGGKTAKKALLGKKIAH